MPRGKTPCHPQIPNQCKVTSPPPPSQSWEVDPVAAAANTIAPQQTAKSPQPPQPLPANPIKPAYRFYTMALGVPASILGLIVSGDVGGITIYTDRHGRKVAYPKAPPTKPPSPLQTFQRDRFRDAMTNWRNATTKAREDYENVSLKASLCMTGVNLWLHFSLKGKTNALNTLSNQTGITLTMPPTV